MKNAIKKLPSNKGPGPDQIPPILVKNASLILTPILQFLFNLSIKNSEFPTVLTQSVITPIPKKGNLQLIQNYRPINKINSFSKIFEIIIYANINNEIMKNICPQQHGFLKQKSTDTNLLIMQHKITETFNENAQLDVIYTDFEKFFDKVPFSTVIQGLKKFNFSNNLITLFKSYLSREMRIKYGQCLSKPIYPTSGFPQGSKLSTLFAIMVVDTLPSSLKHSEALIFADDFKLFKIIKCQQDCVDLQTDVDASQDWAERHGIFFNVDKCEQMSYVNGGINYKYNFEYSISNKNLKKTKEKKDLGITFESNGLYNCHINELINSCFKRLGMIKRYCEEIHDMDTTTPFYNYTFH